VTLALAEGRVSGKSAVNRYFGTYAIAGDGLTFSGLGSTRMAGTNEQMAAEQAYLSALGEIRTYRVVDGKLELLDAAGMRRLVFVRAIDESARGCRDHSHLRRGPGVRQVGGEPL